MTIQEILEAHYVSLTIESRLWCRTCGLITEERHFSATKNHELKLAHVAEVLDKHMQEREAAVLLKARDRMAKHWPLALDEFLAGEVCDWLEHEADKIKESANGR